MTYVDVVFNLAIDKPFTYRIPPEIHTDVLVGQRVLAPFGKREISGVIVHVSDIKPKINCKDVIDILDDKLIIQNDLLRLTQWMSDYYLSSWGSAIQIALPKGLDKRSNVIVEILVNEDMELSELTERQRALFDLIYRDPGKTTHFYKTRYGTGSFDYNLRVLEKKQLIRKRSQVSKERVSNKMIRCFSVADDLSEKVGGLRARDEIEKLLTPFIGKKVPSSDFRQKTGLSYGRINTLLKRDILLVSVSEVYREYTQKYDEELTKIKINKDQRTVLNKIHTAINKELFKVFLLHGVTGSGKTQVYLEAILKVIEQNKSAIVLIPEISLTPQTVSRFKNFFQNNVYVFHSKMSLGERYDTWRKVQQTASCIVIGPRSALFLPVRNLGIIIVDEEHDSSFKQESPAPRYHARDTAIYRAKINDAVVVLGSATPSLESYYNALNGKFDLLHLKNRIDNIELPEVHIIKMKSGGRGEKSKIFSPELIQTIRSCLENKEQVILLQNRRGFASYLQCTTCGLISKCPDCEIYLTYHSSSQSLQCHYCGYSTVASKNCKKCGGTQIRYVGAGTEQIESELHRMIGGIRVLRMDVDTTSGKNAHEMILKRFKDYQADILLGTQMIAKGLDFENVSLVGVISADIGLALPDFRSAERIFQLLTQVSGRAGRKKKQGQVIIQARMDKHYAIKYAQNHDFEGFFNQEITYRKDAAYPPMSRLIKIGISSDKVNQVSTISKDMVRRLKYNSQGIYEVIGPAPAPFIKLKNKYRWQVLIKINTHKDRNGSRAKSLIKIALDPFLSRKQTIQAISLDVDPIDMM